MSSFVVSLVLISLGWTATSDAAVVEDPQNVIALHGTPVRIRLLTNETQNCDIEIGKGSDQFKIYKNGQQIQYTDDVGRGKILEFREVQVDHSDLKRCELRIPSLLPSLAGLYSFTYQYGSRSRGAYVAYLESGPRCTSGRDSVDKHQAGDLTFLTCSLLASVDIQRGLELQWYYPNGSTVERSRITSCSGLCKSVAGSGTNYILTSQVEFVATDIGVKSLTCAVVFNAKLLGSSDEFIADNIAVLPSNCSTRYYPLLDGQTTANPGRKHENVMTTSSYEGSPMKCPLETSAMKCSQPGDTGSYSISIVALIVCLIVLLIVIVLVIMICLCTPTGQAVRTWFDNRFRTETVAKTDETVVKTDETPEIISIPVQVADVEYNPVEEVVQLLRPPP